MFVVNRKHKFPTVIDNVCAFSKLATREHIQLAHICCSTLMVPPTCLKRHAGEEQENPKFSIKQDVPESPECFDAGNVVKIWS
jgi:hypothetical protein